MDGKFLSEDAAMILLHCGGWREGEKDIVHRARELFELLWYAEWEKTLFLVKS